MRGVLIAMAILVAWSASLWGALHWAVDWSHPLTYGWVLLQAHLYTGLFITAHDAMHGVVCRSQGLNHAIGRVCAALFAFNFYHNLFRKHHLHHRYAGTARDPDYHAGSFWPWYLSFARQYITIWQLLLMALAFNGLVALFPEPNVLLYWAIPSVLATFQLFYFGTYLPHRGEHEAGNVHRARSQRRNHWLAFLSCYFFGYHYEHHATPNLPWWKLYQAKDALEEGKRKKNQ